jgi:hypothetical protein
MMKKQRAKKVGILALRSHNKFQFPQAMLHLCSWAGIHRAPFEGLNLLGGSK